MSSISETDECGSPGTIVSEDGSMFIKPATKAEIDFYDAINSDPQYNDLRELCPKYYGRLDDFKADLDMKEILQEKFELGTIPGASHHKVGEPMGTDRRHGGSRAILAKTAIALESLTDPFTKPNTLDIKLGTVLYDNDATLAKKDRFTKVTATSTNKEFGFRFAGMKIWKGHDAHPDFPKPAEGTPYITKDLFCEYDGKWGKELKDDEVKDAFRSFLFEPGARVDAEMSKYVAQKFLEEVMKMERVLKKLVTRMYSASILFVYEGKGEELRQHIEWQKKIDNGEEEPKRDNPKWKRPLYDSDDKFDEEEGDGEEGEEQGDAEAGDEGDDCEGDEYDDEGEPRYIYPAVFKCKLIDFAHAKLGDAAMEHQGYDPRDTEETHEAKRAKRVPAVGRDENMLKGIERIITLLREVQNEIPLTNGHAAE